MVPLERLYDEHASALYAFAVDLTRHEADAADILQEIFCRLAGKPALFAGVRDERAFRPFAWLAGILALALLTFHHAVLSRRESRARGQIGEMPKTGGGAR